MSTGQSEDVGQTFQDFVRLVNIKPIYTRYDILTWRLSFFAGNNLFVDVDILWSTMYEYAIEDGPKDSKGSRR